MLERFKKLYDLKKKADSLKKEMESIHVDFEDRGIKIRIRGDQHFEEVIVDGHKDERLRDAVNKAIKESQKKAAKKMQGRMEDLGF